MSLKVWIDGSLVDQNDAKISVFDHGLLYGDGVFEGIRIYSGKVFELDAHINRLYESAKIIRMEIQLDKQALTAAVRDTVRVNNVTNGYIRLLVTRGVGDLGLNPFLCKKGVTLIIVVDKIQLYPEELYEKGLKVISGSHIRNHPQTVATQAKTLNYLNNVLAKIEALDAGADEVILYNHMGYVAEASGDNVFIVRNGTVCTPPVEAGSLEGITRNVVIRLAEQNGIKVVEKDLTRADLYICDELFLTGTAAEVVGVAVIDGRTIGDGKPGPITKKLRKLFFDYARS